MAAKGFLIQHELEEMGLCLNIPPFLRDKVRFFPLENIQTHTIAQHKLHTECAIAKIRRFSIFERIHIRAAGQMNQLWTVCCLLSNFQDPIL